jgi:hypothetical protein
VYCLWHFQLLSIDTRKNVLIPNDSTYAPFRSKVIEPWPEFLIKTMAQNCKVFGYPTWVGLKNQVIFLWILVSAHQQSRKMTCKESKFE